MIKINIITLSFNKDLGIKNKFNYINCQKFFKIKAYEKYCFSYEKSFSFERYNVEPLKRLQRYYNRYTDFKIGDKDIIIFNGI